MVASDAGAACRDFLFSYLDHVEGDYKHPENGNKDRNRDSAIPELDNEPRGCQFKGKSRCPRKPINPQIPG